MTCHTSSKSLFVCLGMCWDACFVFCHFSRPHLSEHAWKRCLMSESMEVNCMFLGFGCVWVFIWVFRSFWVQGMLLELYVIFIGYVLKCMTPSTWHFWKIRIPEPRYEVSKNHWISVLLGYVRKILQLTPCKVVFPMERRHIWKGGRKIYDQKGKHCGAQLWVGGSQGPAVFMRVVITQYHKITTKPKHTDT